MTVKRGQQYVAYLDERPARRVYIWVIRVAKDGSWADIRCYTWATRLSKRQPLKNGELPMAVRCRWDDSDLEAQMAVWQAERKEASEK